MKQIKELDGIRGLAIILVMLYHFTIPFRHGEHLNWLDELFVKLFGVGWVGVDLFFVLSGFLITGILYETRQKKNYFRNFYARRFLRIFPLYYAVLFGLLIFLPFVVPAAEHKVSSMIENQVWFWSYLVNWKIGMEGSFDVFQGGYMWSLAVEEQFYMLWPFVIFYLKDKVVPFCLTLIVSLAALRVIMLQWGWNATSLYVMTITHLDGLLIGSALAVAIRHSGTKEKATRLLSYSAPLAIAAVIGIMVIVGRFSFSGSEVAAIGLLAIAILSGYLVVRVINDPENSRVNRFFRLPILIYFGKLCYGLYLFHHPIGVFVNEYIVACNAFVLFNSYLPATLANVVVSMAISVFIASLSFRLFEMPFLKLKKHFT